MSLISVMSSFTHNISYQTYLWYSLFSLVYRNIMVCYYAHTYTCTFPSFYTLIGSSDSLDLHIQFHICSILLIRYLERITRIARSSDLFIWSSDLGYCSYFVLHSSFHLCDFLYNPDSALFYLIIHRIMLSYVRNLCIVLQWYLVP